jgi:hypothetical protein
MMERPVVKKETLIMIAVGTLIVLPAASSMLAFAITKNPELRPLNITFESLSAAGLLNNGAEIVAVVSRGENARQSSSQKQQAAALEMAFERYQSDVAVKFRTVPQGTTNSVTFLVGKSKIGPYPIARAASGVGAAVQAERMLKSQQAAVAKKKEMQDAQSQGAIQKFLRKMRVLN